MSFDTLNVRSHLITRMVTPGCLIHNLFWLLKSQIHHKNKIKKKKNLSKSHLSFNVSYAHTKRFVE